MERIYTSYVELNNFSYLKRYFDVFSISFGIDCDEEDM